MLMLLMIQMKLQRKRKKQKLSTVENIDPNQIEINNHTINDLDQGKINIGSISRDNSDSSVIFKNVREKHSSCKEGTPIRGNRMTQVSFKDALVMNNLSHQQHNKNTSNLPST